MRQYDFRIPCKVHLPLNHIAPANEGYLYGGRMPEDFAPNKLTPYVPVRVKFETRGTNDFPLSGSANPLKGRTYPLIRKGPYDS
jgi:hypothetical protein